MLKYIVFLEKQFFLISRFMLFSTFKKIYRKQPLHLLVKWEVVSPNSRYPLYPLFPCSDFVSQMWGGLGGGGGVMFFTHFMLFTTFLEKKNSGNTNFLCIFFMLEILKSAPSLTNHFSKS